MSKDYPDKVKPTKKSGPKAYWELVEEIKGLRESLKNSSPLLSRLNEIDDLFKRVDKIEGYLQRKVIPYIGS